MRSLGYGGVWLLLRGGTGRVGRCLKERRNFRDPVDFQGDGFAYADDAQDPIPEGRHFALMLPLAVTRTVALYLNWLRARLV